MQRETDFWLDYDLHLSPEYAKQLQAFNDETIKSITGDYLAPYIRFPGCLNSLTLYQFRHNYNN